MTDNNSLKVGLFSTFLVLYTFVYSPGAGELSFSCKFSTRFRYFIHSLHSTNHVFPANGHLLDKTRVLRT